MDPCYQTMQGVRGARNVEKYCHNSHSWNTVVCNSRSNQRMNEPLTQYNTDAFLNSCCSWRPLLPDHIPACQMTLPSQTIYVISRHVRGFIFCELDLGGVSSSAYQRRGYVCVSFPSLPLNHYSLQHRRTDGLSEHSTLWVWLRNVTDKPSAFSYNLNTHNWL